MRNFQHASSACLFRLYRPGDMWMEEEEHGPADPIPFCQRAETSHSSLFPSCVLQPGKHHRWRRRGLFHTYLQAEAGMSWRISLRARFISCVCAITGRENEKKKERKKPAKTGERSANVRPVHVRLHEDPQPGSKQTETMVERVGMTNRGNEENQSML